MADSLKLFFDFPYDMSIFKKATNRAKSWVMVAPNTPDPFVKLPHETILYTSPPRTSLELSSINPDKNWKIKSDGGIAYITNQRMVFLPSKPTEELSSFTSPILSLVDTYVKAPFFGANFWVATVKPVPGGGIPPDQPAVELKLTFREGGAFDFHTCFEQIKERLYYAAQMAREQGRTMEMGEDVNTDQLPAYEPATEVHENDGRPPAFVSSLTPGEISRAQVPEGHEHEHGAAVGAHENFVAPHEPPPGYEEAQAQAVEVTFEEERRHRIEMGRDSDAETESDILERREVLSRSPESRREGQPPLVLKGPEGDILQQNPW